MSVIKIWFDKVEFEEIIEDDEKSEMPYSKECQFCKEEEK